MIQKNSLIFFIITLLLVSLVSSSCSRRPKEVLKPKDMENLMVDLHVLEGSLRASGMEYAMDDKKSIYYNALFDKYQITKVEFDSCLSWYTKNPKQFERIYANVMTRIESLRTDVEKGKYHPVDSTVQSGMTNIWNLPTKYVFTKDSARNTLHFEIKNDQLLAKDLYELSFLHRVAPTDSSYNPHVIMYVNYLNGFTDSIYSKTKNDSTLRKYTLKFRARKDLKIKSVSGYLLGNDSAKGEMGAYIDSVKLIRRFNPFRQDSIRSVVLKLDSTVAGRDTLQPLPAISSDSLPTKQPDARKRIEKKPGQDQIMLQQ